MKMLLKEFYDSIGGDYKQVFNQLGDDDIILEFLNKFFTKNELGNLKNSLESCKYKDAFMCVHNIKGFGLNMALTPLYKAADVLCEALRNGSPVVDTLPMLKLLESTYNKIKAALAFV